MDEWLAPALDSDGIELGVVCEVSLISHLSESSCSQQTDTQLELRLLIGA